MSFNYTFTIHRNSPVLTQTVIAEVMPSCSELVFISKPFTDYGACFSEVTLLFNKLGGMLKTPQPEALILHKLNPLLGADTDGKLLGIQWGSDTVCKLFLADTVSLKKGALIFSVSAEIRYDGDLAEIAELFAEPESEEVLTPQ
jgi:hypothetical protein